MKTILVLTVLGVLMVPATAQEGWRQWRCDNCPPVSERDVAVLQCFHDMPSSGDYRRDERIRDACLVKIKLPK